MQPINSSIYGYLTIFHAIVNEGSITNTSRFGKTLAKISDFICLFYANSAKIVKSQSVYRIFKRKVWIGSGRFGVV
ncbi:hypothetical protein ACGTJS_08135 [Faucicola mancuniensis]|uniref:hypothetical protein n=1 Tax=Faucicola mancuniensis TaxID=1309795 RepID=UPI003977A202